MRSKRRADAALQLLHEIGVGHDRAAVGHVAQLDGGAHVARQRDAGARQGGAEAGERVAPGMAVRARA